MNAQAAANTLDPQFGATPLHIAANRGSGEIVSLLLAQPGIVDTEVKDRSGSFATCSLCVARLCCAVQLTSSLLGCAIIRNKSLNSL